MLHSVVYSLLDAVENDEWPSLATQVDFGIVDQQHYEALYYPIQAGEVTGEQLDATFLLGGEALTKLVQSLPSNPHKDIVFKNPYPLGPMPDDDLSDDLDDIDDNYGMDEIDRCTQDTVDEDE